VTRSRLLDGLGEHVPVIHAGAEDDLAMHLDAVREEPLQVLAISAPSVSGGAEPARRRPRRGCSRRAGSGSGG